jgi:hypothetical protein
MSIRKNNIFLFCLFLSSIANAQIRQRGSIAFFPFDNKVEDITGNIINYDSSILDYSKSRQGKSNSCLVLNNKINNQFFDPNDTLNPNRSKSLTFAFWIKLDKKSSDSNQTVFYHITTKKPKGIGYKLIIDKDGFPVLSIINSKKDYKELRYKKSLYDENWHLIVASINDSKTLVLNVDNSSDSSVNLIKPLLSNSDSVFYIGSNSSQKEHFNGLIDNFRMYNLKLSKVDLFSLYTEEINIIAFEIDAFGEHGEYDDCTFQIYKSPNGDKIHINTGKFEKIKNYTINILNKKRKIVDSFIVDKGEYDLDLKKWGGNDIYFMEALDKKKDLLQVYKLNLTN